ncbi:hypothetical protein ES319_A10G181800v1 [Gossypium barbadense]|uniref:Protein FAR1-RELATED SEQUENCE n=1 Tax=Gossypium barbadense TaxID=3634 RepID=A0A5J5U4T5_GOSBA|nr:hypothetical protein ES319_A10G181800v1 [Gossypium barbadense]
MKLSEDGKMQRNRKSSRCGCRAYMRIVKRADFNVPEWRVTAFSNIHNHELLKANETFLGFMKGKAPQTLLTDQNMWLKEAIAIEMPETKHAFSICHIISKFSDWFSVLLGSRYDDWKSDFYRLYGLELLEEFEEEWREMIDKYGLHDNKHIISLYALRTFWALPFLRPYFFAGLTSLCQSETTTTFIQRILSAQSLLDRFVEQVAEVVEFNDRGSKQKQPRKSQKVCLKTGSPIESHAATVLTPYAFGKLQEELLLAPQYASFVVDEGCFEVKHHTQMDGGCEVICVLCEEQISCSCHHFEFSDPYLPSRWRLNSSSSINPLSNATRQHSEKIQLLESLTSALIAESIETKERLDVACEQTAMVLSRIKDLPRTTQSANDIVYNCPSDLILPEVEDTDGIVQSFTMGTSHEPLTSGKLKDRRPRDGIDITRKRRHYSDSCCGHFEHDSSDCPMMEGDNLNGDALGYI